jgi:hypothetical protein
MAITNNAVVNNTAQSKTAGTSLQINNDDITVAAGDDLFLAYAGDDVGSAFGVTHAGTAAITWTQVKEQINVGNAKAQLWNGHVTAGGTVTSVTIAWTTNVTAKAAVLGWFSGVGTQDTGTGSPYGASATGINQNAGAGTWETGDLLLAMTADEAANDAETPSPNIEGGTGTMIGQDGTIGGGAASNMVCGFAYKIAAAAGPEILGVSETNSRDYAAAGAVYSPAAVAVSDPTSWINARRTPRRRTLQRM